MKAQPARASDLETRASRTRHRDLQLWLRILTVHKLVNNEVRRRLREKFDMSLSRFDLLAQLDGAPDGMRMGELSKRLMVTTGNITGLTDELEADGLVERLADPTNRRASLVRMTAKGRKAFGAAASTNETWIEEMFSGITPADKASLFEILGRHKEALARLLDGSAAPARSAPRRNQRALTE